MTFKAALSIDPEWRLQPPPVDLKQYYVHVKTELGKLPPIDFLMTAVNRDDEYLIAELFQDGTGNTPNPNWPTHHIPSPHFKNTISTISRWNKHLWLNHKILSTKLTQTDKATKKQIPVPNRIPVNTAYGLLNANASSDAVTRMLTNTKHKIDQIIIIDPYNTIRRGLTNWYTQAGTMNETITAWSYARNHPAIPCAVIV